MFKHFCFVALVLLAFTVHLNESRKFWRTVRGTLSPEEQELKDYLQNVYEIEASKIFHDENVAGWNFATDVKNETKIQAQETQSLLAAQFLKQQWQKHFKGLKPEMFKDPIVKREVFFLATLGVSALDPQKFANFTKINLKMENIYSTAKVCPYKNQDCSLEKEGLSLDPEIEGIMATSTDYDELEYFWTSWRDASGAKIRNTYKAYVEISNEAARLNGAHDMGEMWRRDFESDTFVEDMDELWKEVMPLYDELHTYVLNKLRTRYPQIGSDEKLIPAHLLGNMWAQTWQYLFDFVKPYPNASVIDVTKELKNQSYTVLKMFEASNEFYQSLGLESCAMSYNESLGAVIEKPKDREITCHASAWDFQDGIDFRIKMCTKINQEDFITIHHEMGHIQYYILYKNQPVTLRNGANPGFHEAVGDTIALSVSTPQHLEKVGLLRNHEDTPEASLNDLMQMALERVAFLPFGLLIDKWRWDVFKGDVQENEWNQKWWEYREQLQKVKAPNKRTEKDFDPGAKYHVAGDSQYISYFVAHILEFQFYRSLCMTAGEYNSSDPHTKPLYKCDIHGSKEAGKKLRAGLSLGASRHWSEALEAITGEKKLSGSSILEYFQPLYNYLKNYNSKGF